MKDKDNIKTEKSNIKIFLLISLAAILLYAFASCQDNTPQAVDIEPDQNRQGPEAPNFTFPDLDGRMVSLSDYKGKVVLVNIWATWCPPCVAETPSIDKLNKIFEDDDFALLAVSVDEGGKNAVKSFMKKKNLSFPVLLDPRGSIQRLYGTSAVPESFIIRKDGTIDNKVIGAIDWASPKVIEYFKKLMQES